MIILILIIIIYLFILYIYFSFFLSSLYSNLELIGKRFANSYKNKVITKCKSAAKSISSKEYTLVEPILEEGEEVPNNLMDEAIKDAIRYATRKYQMPDGVDKNACIASDKKLKLSIKGKELVAADHISQYLLKILNYEVLIELYAGIEENSIKGFAVGMADKMVSGMVNAAVNPAWSTMEAAAKPVKTEVETAVNGVVLEIFKQQEKIKNEIIKNISGTVDPFIEKAISSTIKPIISQVVKPIGEALLDLIKKFEEVVLKPIDECVLKAKEDIKNIFKDIKKHINRLLKSISDKIQSMVDAINTQLVKIGFEFDAQSLKYPIISELRTLMMRAICDVEQEINKLTDFTGKNGFIGALNATIKNLITDSKKQLGKIVNTTLIGILSDETDAKIMTPIMDLVSPIQETLDGLPVVGELMPLDELVKDTLDEIFSSAFDSVSKGCLTDANALLDSFLEKKVNETKIVENS
jgi:hypothetical protein